MARKRHQSKSGGGQVRIIAGQWRGRRLPVADVPGLRPSGDRGRETLFNWLQTHVNGARCADLFAGTGALGFEAASRGAAQVWLIEKNRQAANALRESGQLLKAQQVQVVEGDALSWLDQQEPQSLDLVFVDPPFESGLVSSALEHIKSSGCLVPDGLVYLECSRTDPEAFATGFIPVKDKIIGEVQMWLLKESGKV